MGRYVFKLPDVGEGTAEAEIVAWHVKVGDRIEEDQHLVDVMTDKATVEMPSPVPARSFRSRARPARCWQSVRRSSCSKSRCGQRGSRRGRSAGDAEGNRARAAEGREFRAGQDQRSTAQHRRWQLRFQTARRRRGHGGSRTRRMAHQAGRHDHGGSAHCRCDDGQGDHRNSIARNRQGISIKGRPARCLTSVREILVLQVEGAGSIGAQREAPSPPKPEPAKPRPSTAASAPAKPAPAAAEPKPAARGGSKPAFATRTPGEKPLASPAVRRRAWESSALSCNSCRARVRPAASAKPISTPISPRAAARASGAATRSATASRRSRSSACAARSPRRCRSPSAASRISPMSRRST